MQVPVARSIIGAERMKNVSKSTSNGIIGTIPLVFSEIICNFAPVYLYKTHLLERYEKKSFLDDCPVVDGCTGGHGQQLTSPPSRWRRDCAPRYKLMVRSFDLKLTFSSASICYGWPKRSRHRRWLQLQGWQCDYHWRYCHSEGRKSG